MPVQSHVYDLHLLRCYRGARCASVDRGESWQQQLARHPTARGLTRGTFSSSRRAGCEVSSVSVERERVYTVACTRVQYRMWSECECMSHYHHDQIKDVNDTNVC